MLSVVDPMNPFPADCPGFEDFFTAIGQPGLVCEAFRADMWAPPETLSEQYTCALDWYTRWTDSVGDPIAVSDEPVIVDGFDLPALLPLGETSGPGVCVAATPPDPPDPPAPPTPPGPGGTGGTGTGTNPAGTGASGSTPTLPATGATAPVLLGAAVLLLLGGATALRMARRTARGQA